MQRHAGLTTKEGMAVGINERYKIQKITTMPVNTLLEAHSLNNEDLPPTSGDVDLV